MQDSRVTVMVADALQLTGEAISEVFSHHPDFSVVSVTHNPEDTLRYISGRKPDVLVLGAPGIVDANSIERFVSQVGCASPQTGIVLLATADDVDLLQASLRAGIQNYTSRREGIERLIKASSRASEDGSYFCPSMMDVLVRATRRQDSDLSERELNVLKLLGFGHTNSEISELLHLSVRTIEAHRSAIQEKLQVSARYELTREALDRGLVS